jgi:hypothetical protein
MPAIFALLMGFLVNVAGSIAGRVMISLGVSLVTYTGINASLNFALDYISHSWSSLPAITLEILGTLRVSQDLAILTGAITAKLVLKGLSSDSLSFWVMRGKLG